MNWLADWLGDERWGRWLVFGPLFLFSLAFFLHYQEVKVDVLELNSTAQKYVLAQVGFEFPDVEATALLKKESQRDVGKIFCLDEGELSSRVRGWQDILVNDSSWRISNPAATFERMYEGGEAVREKLSKIRFVDERTLNKMQELKLSIEDYLIFSPSEMMTLLLPSFFSQDLAPDFALEYFRQQKWNLQEDLSAQNAVRQAVKAGVALKMTKVEPGGHIINAGEKVTPRHLDMMKAMKKMIGEQRNPLTPMTVLGSLVLSFIFSVLSSLYLWIHHPAILRSFKKTALLGTIVILTLALAKFTDYIFVNKSGSLVDLLRYPVFVPFGTLLVTLLVGGEVALVTSGFTALVLCLTLSVEYDHFLVVNLVATLITIASARAIRRRKDIVEISAKMWLGTIPVLLAFNMIENTFWNFHLVTDLLTTFFFISGSAIVVIGILPILESAFNIVSDMTLAEYMDPNHPLLSRLALESPGTYQHSLVVATISEAAAQAIGANGLYCRVSSLYHDIGKLFNPHYFTENQFTGFNIHQLLTPQESAQVIIAHVMEGVVLAQKYDLPESFIDIIKEHHGTTLTYFFYRAQIELMGGDCGRVDLLKFRYGGPKPQTKESAIIMIADCMEAAIRSMEEVCERSVEEVIDRIVKDRIEEGQFDECNLTFEELVVVKKSMLRTLLATRHARVKYPVKRDAIVSRIEEIAVPRI